ncbi:MAG: tetratricopeptide repeat protein [Myxococcota bacterium]
MRSRTLALCSLAREERPSSQAEWGLKANILICCGQPEAATPLAEQSLRLSPVAQTFFPEVLATAHYLCGRLEDAIATAHDSLALAPDSVDARVVLAASFAETGRIEAARQAAREILSIDPRISLSRFAATRPYRDATVSKRVLDALQQAGLPEGDEAAPVIALARPEAAARRRVAPRPRH